MTNVKPETRPERLAAALAWMRAREQQDKVLARVRALAAEFYEPEHIDLFLNSRNELLDNWTAMEMIRAGKGEKVINVLQRMADGAYI